MTKVKLLHYTPIHIVSHAIRQCWDTHDKSDDGGPCDIALIDRVGNKHKHESTLEHAIFNFELVMSRACLQEWARHRIASLSVKSSRYTLKELKDEQPFELQDIDRASKYIYLTGNHIVDTNSIVALENLRITISTGLPNDIAKYCMPEAYLTQLSWSINLRSLRNFLSLRTNKAALAEIRELAYEIAAAVPQEYQFLIEPVIYKE